MKLKDLYAPPHSRYVDTENYHRNPNMFSYITLITQVINTIFLFVSFAQGKNTSVGINLFAIITMAANGIYFKRTGHFRNAFAIYSLLALLVISFDHMVEPSYNGSNLFWYAPCLFSCFYLLDKARAIFVAGCGFSMFAAAYVYKFYNVFPVTINTTTPAQALVINVLTMFVSTIAIYFVSRFFFKEEHQVKAKLKELSAANASLISILTHDLSTPAMVAGSFLKRSRSCDKSYERIRRSLQKISDIITDTRELHALGTGKKDITLALTNVESIIQSTICDYSYLAEDKQIDLVFENSISRGRSILVDPNSFQNNVLSNIISNAVKFSSPDGQIKISTFQRDKSIVISIKDNGVGIPKEIQDKIFDVAAPTSRKGTMGEADTGFGLPIVKMFMDLYNATIHVDSYTVDERDDHGTTFELIFPEVESPA